MPEYDHGGDIYGNKGVYLDFSVSVNPLGMPDEVSRALVVRAGEFSRYPDPHCRELTAALALHENVPESWILCGNGAADLIYRICHALKPRLACVPSPAFSEYEKALRAVGCRVESELIPGCDVAFLCHPNNPTGLLLPAETLEAALETGATVVVDECFLDFTDGESVKKHLNATPRLVVLKAFTKIYAMAGLRLGYALCADAALLEKINAASQCWSVSSPAQVAGVAALGCNGWIEKTRQLVKKERRFMTESLSELGLMVLPSDANFLLFICEKPLYEPLLKKGILIRSCASFRGLDGAYCRIGLKTRAENTRLIEAIKEVLNG